MIFHLNDAQAGRLRHLCRILALVLGAGLLYVLLCFARGGPVISCPFYRLTGLQCPGCGVSRMCLALLRLDFAAAFQANAMLLALLPVGLVFGAAHAVRFVRTGPCALTRLERTAVWIMAALLVIFGIWRNLPAQWFA